MSASAAPHVSVPDARIGAAGLDRSSTPRWSRRVAIDLVAMCDMAAVVAGATVPALIYADSGQLDVRWLSVVQAALVTSAIVFTCLRSWRMYETGRLHNLPIRPQRIAAALLLSSFAVLGIGLPFAPADVHMWLWYAAWLTSSFTLMIGGRMLSHAILCDLTAAGRFDTHVAVYGAGAIARRVERHLTDRPAGIAFSGVYDDRARNPRADADGLPIAGNLDDLIAAGRNGRIDQIIIALPPAADGRITAIAAKLEQLPVSLHVVTHLATDLIATTPKHKVSSIGSVGMIDVKAKPLSDWAPFVKRTEDYVVGALLLVLLSPIIAMIALAVKLDSPGPVLFRQRRRGLNHRVIEVLKFRTMTVMEDGETVAQATRSDPRVTRIGGFLRRSSLDELPQLFNVLKGEMSLVGPRPHALIHDEKWGELLETYANRHQVKPGITGLAQVEGWRGETRTTDKMQARVECDLAYIRNWSLGLDLSILLRTVRAVFTGHNAH